MKSKQSKIIGCKKNREWANYGRKERQTKDKRNGLNNKHDLKYHSACYGHGRKSQAFKFCPRTKNYRKWHILTKDKYK